MRSRSSFILKAGLSIVLCFILLVGTMTVGLAAIRDELSATGWNTSSSGIKLGAVYYCNGEKTAWSVSGTNSSWYQDFDILTAGTYEYLIVGDKDFGYRNVDGAGAFDDTRTTSYYAHEGAGRTNLSAYFPAGQYVLHLEDAGGSNQDYIKYTLNRKKYIIDYGWDSGVWTNGEMLYEGDSNYSYTFDGNGQELRFRTRRVDSGSTTTYYPSSTDFIGDNTSSSKYGASWTTEYYDGNAAGATYWHISTATGYRYTIWQTNNSNNDMWVTITPTTGYFLTGWISDAATDRNVDIKDENKFTETATDSGIYTLIKRFNSSENHSYPTISRGDYTVYHPQEKDSDNNTQSYSTDHVPSNDYKWKVYAPAGTIIKFTWNTNTSPNPTLSWENVTAKYVFEYTNRDGITRSYSVDGTTNPTAAEYADSGRLNKSSRSTEVSTAFTTLAGSGVFNVFGQTLSFNDSIGTWDTDTPYTIKVTLTSTETRPSLTVYTYNNSGNLVPHSFNDQTSLQGDFNTPVDLTALNNNVPLNGGPADKVFIGWRRYNGSSFSGDILSTQANYGCCITRDMSIAPYYGTQDELNTMKNAGWQPRIERNEITKEMTGASTGTIYNDNMVGFRYGTEMTTAFNTSTDECGIVILVQSTASADSASSKVASLTDNNVKNYVNYLVDHDISFGKLNSDNYGDKSYALRIKVNQLSNLNRVNIHQALDYADFNGAPFKVISYTKVNGSFTYSSVLSSTCTVGVNYY